MFLDFGQRQREKGIAYPHDFKSVWIEEASKKCGPKKKFINISTIVKVKALRNHTIQALSAEIQKELSTMASKRTQSLFRDKSRDGFRKFSWDSIIAELQVHAPILLKVLKSCIDVKRKKKCNVKRANKNRRKINSIVGIMCFHYFAQQKFTHELVSTNNGCYSWCWPCFQAGKQTCVTMPYNYTFTHADFRPAPEDAIVFVTQSITAVH